jgi:G3E family GTPase
MLSSVCIDSTFNQEQEIKDLYRIDSILGVVDAKHITLQLARAPSGDSVTVRTVNEAAQQIAFSDR